MASQEGHNHDLPAAGENGGRFGEVLHFVVASLHMNFGFQCEDQPLGSPLVKGNYAIDAAQLGKDRRTVLQGIYRAVRALGEPPRTCVAIQAYDQQIPQRAG